MIQFQEDKEVVEKEKRELNSKLMHFLEEKEKWINEIKIREENLSKRETNVEKEKLALESKKKSFKEKDN